MGAGSVGSASRPSLARAVPPAPTKTHMGSRLGPELVGRRDELAALDDELARAVGGEFRVVLLQGEAGTGKSRLARELLRRHRQVTGLTAQGYPLAASAAFGLWTEAIDPFLQSLPDGEVVELCEGLLDDLASLFRRVALIRGALPERDPPLPRLLQGLAGLLGNVARRTPLAVLLDDVHFADPSSWEALRYFARHLDDARLLVVATTRSAELSTHDIAAQVLFELEQDELLSRIDVEPLGRAGLAELAEAVIGHPPPGPLVDWIAERSQGNPLFAIGLLRALIEEQGDLGQPHLHRLPEGLTERVTSELRRFAEPEREILELLAVVGRPVSFGDIAALSGSELDDIGPILSQLANSGIVIEEERGTALSYELHHPLVRDVVYQATGGARRRVLHRQAARSLREGGHLPEAALHFARSAERGDSEAVDVLLDAMRQAERREAYREALELQAELVELLPADDVRWLEVLDAMYERAEWLIDHRAETNAPVAVRPCAPSTACLSSPPTRPGARSSSSASQRSSPGGRESSTRRMRHACRHTISSGVRASGSRRCWPLASWRGSPACAATWRGWEPRPARWSTPPMRPGIGSSPCRALPLSATAQISAGSSRTGRRRCVAPKRSPARTTRRIG